MYKCQQADGSYSFQGNPCPENASQQVLQTDGRSKANGEAPGPRAAGHRATKTAQPAVATASAADPPLQTEPAETHHATHAVPVQQTEDHQPRLVAGAFALLGAVVCFAASLWSIIARGDLGYVFVRILFFFIDAVTGNLNENSGREAYEDRSEGSSRFAWFIAMVGLVLLIFTVYFLAGS